jgi:hypothetical protein
MISESTLKIQTHVVSTIINFAKGLMTEEEGDDEVTVDTTSAKLMEIYSKTLFENLIVLLKKGMDANYEPLQEEVMNLLSVVATIIDTEFAKYYSVLVPIMTDILRNVPSTTMSQMTLRAKTIEALGFMIEAVTDEKAAFLKNVTEITRDLLTYLLSGTMGTDDPQVSAIKDTLAKTAGFLKEDFQQFLPQLLPILVNDSKVDIDIKMESAEMPKTSDNAGFTFKMKGFEGNQRLTMNTSALEAKVSAFKLINLISENMGAAFAPFAEPLLPVVLENTTYKYSAAIRKYSMKTLVNTLSALGLPNSVMLFKQLFTLFAENIRVSLDKEDLKELKTLLKHFWLMTKTMNEQQPKTPTYMEAEMFTKLGELMGKVLSLVSVAKKESSSLVNQKNIVIDEEDLEVLKEQISKLTKPATYVMEISGQLCQGFKTLATTMVKENLLNYFAILLTQYKTLSESELLDATCFFCDFVEYSFHTDVAMMTELTQKFLEIFAWSGATTDVK